MRDKLYLAAAGTRCPVCNSSADSATLVITAPQFTGLTEAEVMAALNGNDLGNSIALEVARLVVGYRDKIRAPVERLSSIPENILKPPTAIEAVALRLATEAILDEIQKSRSI